MTQLVLGGYGPAIGVVDVAPDGFGAPVHVASAQRPSFVIASADGRFVYAVLESEDGHVGAWAVTDEGPWRPLGQQSTGGADPCHLALSPDGRWLLTANYTSGSVSVHPVEDGGSLGASTDL
ncbi:MAG TPA: beta-propeller fold lactonase family protein, partial [Lapillicoccus sp.]|nr:beta-propeller fold lactonase family protein [Lapillicoccus sp.]